jgi:predicted TIM-barrel fold metal-dependent hydrolase
MVLEEAEKIASARDAQLSGAIDVDLHPQIVDWQALAVYASEGLRHRVARTNGPPMARHGFKPVGTAYGTAPLPSGPEGKIGQPAGDPAYVKQNYLDARGITTAILTTDLTNLAVQPNIDMAATVARAYNDWILATWVRPFDCYRASILVAPQDATQAVAEIDRLADDPGVAQVLVPSATESPLGRRQYHPIYEACVRHNLPLSLHFGGEGAGMAPAATAVGHPSTYMEWYGSLPQSYMAHIMSMITEGVFEKYPTLKVILNEGGVFWLPHIMWRFDKNWKAQRAETPWVKRPPSEYILQHFYSTTYPLESMPDPAHFDQVFAMIDAEHRLLFAGNYPHWEAGDPIEMLDTITGDLRRRVLTDTARELYGGRVGSRRS